MKNSKATDPISIARAATNNGNAVRSAKRIYKQRWADLDDTRKEAEFLVKHWEPCSKALRAAFRSEFRSKVWAGLSIKWIGRGYSMNHVTHKVAPWMNYEIYWKGIFIRRNFSPESIADMHIEAWRLGSALAGWANPGREGCEGAMAEADWARAILDRIDAAKEVKRG